MRPTTVTNLALALAAAAIACCVGAASASAQGGDLIVKTTAGPVQGIRSGNLNAFLGIPYASAGRWEAPQDPAPWSEPFQANQYGPICPQAQANVSDFVDSDRELLWAKEPWNIVTPPPSFYNQSEDCLSINVYAPVDAAGAPVMFWIYGGGFFMGSSNGFDYPPGERPLSL